MKKIRIINVDLIRFFAILLVIGCHIILPPININGTVDVYKTCIAAFVGGGVGLFWIISGFFAFNDRSFYKKFTHLIKSILIPVLVLILFSQIFYNYIKSNLNIIQCINSISIDTLNIKSIVNGFINRNSSLIPLGEHLWYVLTYVENFFWIPLLTILFKSKDSKIARYLIYGFGLSSMLIGTIQKFFVLEIGFTNLYRIVPVSIMYMMIGYEIFSKKEQILNNKKLRWFSFLGYLIFLGLKMCLQVFLYKKNVADVFFLSWAELPSLIENIFLVLFILSFNIKGNKIMQYIGKNVFGIYLVHWIVKEKIVSSGRSIKLYNFLNCQSASFLSTLAYTIVMTVIVLICSIIILVMLDIVKYVVKKVFYKIKKIFY